MEKKKRGVWTFFFFFLMSQSFRIWARIKQNVGLNINLNIVNTVWHFPQKDYVAAEVGKSGSHSGCRRVQLANSDNS